MLRWDPDRNGRQGRASLICYLFMKARTKTVRESVESKKASWKEIAAETGMLLKKEKNA
jgi:hypothetical protein